MGNVRVTRIRMVGKGWGGGTVVAYFFAVPRDCLAEKQIHK